MGYVIANDVATGAELWKVKIFHIHIKPWIEGDNQWVFISDLKLMDHSLLVENEKSHCYRVDLSTRRVQIDMPLVRKTRFELSHNLAQRLQQPLHFFHRVVMHQPDTQKTSQSFDVQLLGDIQCVVVAIPGEEAAFA
jgi:hypothetical protein